MKGLLFSNALCNEYRKLKHIEMYCSLLRCRFMLSLSAEITRLGKNLIYTRYITDLYRISQYACVPCKVSFCQSKYFEYFSVLFLLIKQEEDKLSYITTCNAIVSVCIVCIV